MPSRIGSVVINWDAFIFYQVPIVFGLHDRNLDGSQNFIMGWGWTTNVLVLEFGVGHVVHVNSMGGQAKATVMVNGTT